MSVFSCLFYVALYTSLSAAQSVVCVWNSLNYYDWFNGEYHRVQNLTFQGYPYFIKDTPATCGILYLHTYYDSNDGYEQHYWQIASSLLDYYVDYTPYCDSSPYPSDPSSCVSSGGDWYQYEYYQGIRRVYDMSVTDGPCPSLDCDLVQLTGTGLLQCDQVFSRNTNYDNVWQNDGTYLYFNQNTFRWYCSSTLGMDECFGNDNLITHFYVSSKYDGWNQVTEGDSFQLTLHNDNIATFHCLDTETPTSTPTQVTNQPTFSPTINPTQSTNQPTFGPTIATANPTQSTKQPTAHPTQFTDNPTYYPTSQPTFVPTRIPTMVPTTNQPSINPTIYPTIVPTLTFNPTSIPTIEPTSLATATNAYVDENVSKKNGEGLLNGSHIMLIIIFCSLIALLAICLVVTRIYIFGNRYKINNQNMEKEVVQSEANQKMSVTIGSNSKKNDTNNDGNSKKQQQLETQKTIELQNQKKSHCTTDFNAVVNQSDVKTTTPKTPLLVGGADVCEGSTDNYKQAAKNINLTKSEK